MYPSDQAAIDAVVATHGVTVAGLAAAFEQGLLIGAMRAAQVIASGAVAGTTTTTGEDDDDNAALSASDVAALKRLGIDPSKKWRQRNTVFTVCAYKPSRWKYPVSVVTQQGARYKMTAAQVIAGQK